MKGIVFTEFIELVEDKFGFDVADKIIEGSDLPSGGSYTTVGTYNHQEILALVAKLSEETDVSETKLIQSFGTYLFARFYSGFPQFFENIDSAFSFLKSVEKFIHTEVKKLYNDAELPRIECIEPDKNKLVLVYKSGRGLAALAEGLIYGCIEHFKETIEVAKEDISGGKGQKVLFTLTRQCNHEQ